MCGSGQVILAELSIPTVYSSCSVMLVTEYHLSGKSNSEIPLCLLSKVKFCLP